MASDRHWIVQADDGQHIVAARFQYGMVLRGSVVVTVDGYEVARKKAISIMGLNGPYNFTIGNPPRGATVVVSGITVFTIDFQLYIDGQLIL